MSPEQKFAQQMQKLNPEYQQKFFDALQQFFAESIFPKEDIPEGFQRMRFASLIHVTEQDLQISTNNFLGLLLNKELDEYSIGNMIAIIKGSEKTSLIDYIHVYGNTPEIAKEYADYRIAMHSLTELVNAIIDPEKDRLVRKMLTTQGLQVNAGNRKIALG